MKMPCLYTEPTLDWLAAFNKLLDVSGAGAYQEAKYSFRLPDTDPLTLSKWQKAGVAPLCRAGNKFSVLSLAWMAVLKECYAFGLTTGCLISVKTALYQPLGNTHLNSLFFSFLLASLHPDENVYLVVPSSGTAFAGLAGDIFYNQAIGNLSTEALLLNLNKIWTKIFPSIKVKEEFLCSLNPGELEVVGLLRTSAANEIKVKRGNSGIGYISEFFESQMSPAELADLAKDVNFGEVSVKIKDGKVVYIKTENKKKIQ